MLKKDSDILNDMSFYLSKHYRAGATLSGVVYTHNVASTRFTKPTHRNVRMREDSCGPDCMNRIFMVTTMWDTVSEDVGSTRERDWITTPEY